MKRAVSRRQPWSQARRGTWRRATVYVVVIGFVVVPVVAALVSGYIA